MPKTNVDFWQKKIGRNKERDSDTQHALAAMGWHCITVWECQLKPTCRQQTLLSLEYTLNRIFLSDNSRGYAPLEEEMSFDRAAEDMNRGDK